jgi:polyvinyl alcohol dehydrogenase (cytochrome)
MRVRRLTGLALASLPLVACKASTPAVVSSDSGVAATPLDCAVDGGDWPMFGQNVCNTRSSPGTAIDTTSAPELALKWQLPMAGDVSATPAVVEGRIYVPDWGGMMSCIDAASHAVVWSRSISDILGLTQDGGTDGASPASGDDAGSAAGVRGTSVAVARDTPVVSGSLLIFGVASQPAAMVAVDRATGALVWQRVLDPHPYADIASSPTLDNGIVYVGVASGEEGASLTDPTYQFTFRGSVAALDAATGALIWQTHTIDDDVYLNHDQSLAGFAGAAVWSSPTVDRKRKQIYVTTGNNYAVGPAFADGGALPAGDRLESIIALDMTTGKIEWSERMTAGDVWNFGVLANKDWDFGASANLFQANVGGGLHDVVGAGQKSGVYWAVDPDTGETLWHTQVGPGGHLGGIQWGTAVDGTRIYVGVNDTQGDPYTLGGAPDAGKTSAGSWAALDPATGQILWQVANPTMTAPLQGASVNGPVTVLPCGACSGGAHSVLLVGSMDAMGTMLALDATTGKTVWSYVSGATVYGAPAVVDGVVYWGNGYPSGRLFFGTPGATLFAFSLP